MKSDRDHLIVSWQKTVSMFVKNIKSNYFIKWIKKKGIEVAHLAATIYFHSFSLKDLQVLQTQ